MPYVKRCRVKLRVSSKAFDYKWVQNMAAFLTFLSQELQIPVPFVFFVYYLYLLSLLQKQHTATILRTLSHIAKNMNSLSEMVNVIDRSKETPCVSNGIKFYNNGQGVLYKL